MQPSKFFASNISFIITSVRWTATGRQLPGIVGEGIFRGPASPRTPEVRDVSNAAFLGGHRQVEREETAVASPNSLPLFSMSQLQLGVHDGQVFLVGYFRRGSCCVVKEGDEG